jgi:hypothetical protein
MAGITVIGIVAASAGIVATSNRSESFFPPRWDPRVAPIAAEVARLRGLDFEHPVAIKYLPPTEFEKKLMGDGESGGDASDARASAKRDEAVFRALGFIGGKVDLLKEADQSGAASTLAYYDPRDQDIIVRGTTFDVAHRVTVAHELTHVLQDQHLDITKLQEQALRSDTGDVFSLKALIEGDAVRIEEDYLKQLSPAQRREYARENDAEGARVGAATESVPDILGVLSGAPYALGPSTIRVLLADGGNRAVDDAITGPTPSSGVFVRTGDISPAVPVEAPLPSGDGVVTGPTETFGPFELFLTLSMRLEPARALAAADVVAGGSATTFSSNGVTCYRVVVDPASATSQPFLEQTLSDWARARPRTTVDTAGDNVGFTVCDPGRGAPDPPKSRVRAAYTLLNLRTDLTVEVAKEHVSADVARCFGRVFVATPGAATLLLTVGNNRPTPEQDARLGAIARTSGASCRDDPTTGLE